MMTPGKSFLLLFFVSLNLFQLHGSDSRPLRRITFSGMETVLPGKLAVTVVPGSPAVVRFAGKELSMILSRRLGFPVPVLEKPALQGRSVVLGVNALSRNAGIKAENFCRDSFTIKTHGNLIFIAGRDDPEADPEKTVDANKTAQYFERGTLFGVYDFLERFAGVRFYFAGKYGTVIPRGRMTLPKKIDIFDRPDFEIRKLNMETGFFSETPGKIVKPRNNFSFGGQKHREKNLSGYRLRIQTLLQPNSHGLAHLELGKRFARNHSEYFALLPNGKRDSVSQKEKHSFHLCFSSGVKEEIYLDAKAYLSGRPSSVRGISRWNPHGQCSQIFDLQPQDGFAFCRCSLCKKSMASPQAASRSVWDFILDIAEKLQKEKIPGTLQMMAYYPYTLPPQRKLPANLLLQVAVNGPWMHTLDDQQDQLVRSWKEKNNGKVMLWNYCGKWSLGKLPGIPHWTPRRIGAYYRHTSPWITGAYLLCDGDYYIFSALNMYVFAKTAWDNRCDTGALLKEFYSLMFGNAEHEMAQFFDRLEELWLKMHSRLVETVTGPLIAPPSEYELFEVYFSPDELKRMKELFDRAETKTAANREHWERVRFMRWNFLDRIQRASQEYFKLNTRDFRGDGALISGEIPDWDKVPRLYLQRKDGRTSPDLTTVQTALSKEALFIRIFCTEPEPEAVSSSADTVSSAIWKQDNVEIFLNPGCDLKNYFQLIINSAGVLFSQRGVLTGILKKLTPYTVPGIQHQVEKKKNGFLYTVKIPVSSLPGLQKKLVCNFLRNQNKKGKSIPYTWSVFVNKNNHDLHRFGKVEFKTAPAPAGNLITDGDFSQNNDRPQMFGAWRSGRMEEGTDVRYDTGTFISGFRSLQISRKRTSKVSTSVSIPVKLKKNQRYRLSFYVKLDRVTAMGKNGGVNVGVWTGVNRWCPENRLTGTTPWLKQSMEFVTNDKDKLQGKLNLFMYQCTGTANFDRLVLEEIK